MKIKIELVKDIIKRVAHNANLTQKELVKSMQKKANLCKPIDKETPERIRKQNRIIRKANCKSEPKCKPLMTFKKPITEKALQKMIKKAMGDFKMPYVIKNLEPLQSKEVGTTPNATHPSQKLKPQNLDRSLKTTQLLNKILTKTGYKFFFKDVDIVLKWKDSFFIEGNSAQQQEWKEGIRKKLDKYKCYFNWDFPAPKGGKPKHKSYIALDEVLSILK